MNEVANTTEINSQPRDMLSIIERVANNGNIDLDRFERLVALRHDELSRIAKANFNNAMSAAQAEIKPVAKDAANNHTRSKYATYEAISKAIQPIIERHGFAISFNEGKPELDGFVKLICTVSHGEYEKQFEANIPLDGAGAKGNSNKNATQAYGSTITYGRRFLKAMIFDVSVTDEDDDAQSVGQPIITDQQFKQLQILIDETKPDVDALCRTYGINAISHLPSNMFLVVLNILEGRKAKQQQKAKENTNANHS